MAQSPMIDGKGYIDVTLL